jgi:hypothetical protein
MVFTTGETARKSEILDDSGKLQIDEDDTSCDETDEKTWLMIDLEKTNEKTYRVMSKSDRKLHWTKARQIIAALFAHFVVAKGIHENAATIARLEATATPINTSTKDSLEDIASRILRLQREVLGGEVGEEQEAELGRLIASVIFSRKRDEYTKAIVQRKRDAGRARAAADGALTSKFLAQRAEVSEEGATVAAKLWLSRLLQDGLDVISNAQSGKSSLKWVSKLDYLK